MFDIQKMARQAQKMQEEMAKIQDDLGNEEVTGSAGGGAVTVTCTGQKEFRAVKISADAASDPEMLEDLVLGAIQDATKKATKLAEDRLSALTAGMNLPGGFKIPGF